MGMIERMQGFQGNQVLKKERKIIDRMLKNSHLILLDNDMLRYTDRAGIVKDVTLDEMAMLFVDSVGGVGQIVKVGLTIDSFKNVLIEAQNKVKKENGGKIK